MVDPKPRLTGPARLAREKAHQTGLTEMLERPRALTRRIGRAAHVRFTGLALTEKASRALVSAGERAFGALTGGAGLLARSTAASDGLRQRAAALSVIAAEESAERPAMVALWRAMDYLASGERDAAIDELSRARILIVSEDVHVQRKLKRVADRAADCDRPAPKSPPPKSARKRPAPRRAPPTETQTKPPVSNKPD